jgi:hypothetical protein
VYACALPAPPRLVYRTFLLSHRQSLSPQERRNIIAEVVSFNIGREKGVNKEPVDRVALRVDHGIEGDAHAGDWHRQVSLLAEESIDFMR